MPEKLKYIICDLSNLQECLDKYGDKIKFIVNYDSLKMLIVFKE